MSTKTDISPSDKDVERLEKALEFSNTMQTFNLNKNNLKIKTQNLLNDSNSGGSFNVNQSLISFMHMIVQSGKTEVVILDKNDIPIKVEDTAKFLEDISSLYPILSGSKMLMIVLAGIIFLNEKITIQKAIGTGSVLLGLSLLVNEK